MSNLYLYYIQTQPFVQWGFAPQSVTEALEAGLEYAVTAMVVWAVAALSVSAQKAASAKWMAA
jgi:hypothetical protein